MGVIKYYLMPNMTTPDPNDQMARISPKEILDENTIAERMVKRSSSYTLPIIKGVLELFFDVVTDEISNGNHVNTPLVNIKPGINGTFVSATDNFDPARHLLKATISQGVLLNQKMKSSQVEKILKPIAQPVLVEYNDVNSKTFNSKITKGGIGIIIGEELKFNPANVNEGVFFYSEDNEITKVSNLAGITNGKIIFTIPSTLVAGNYTLKVIKAYGKHNELRTGELHEILTVAP